jgi:large subunit ribosomal protein L18
MIYKKNNQKNLLKRQRTHNKIKGVTNRPRLVVFRSSKNISAQIINDLNGTTLAQANSLKIDKNKVAGKIFFSEIVGKTIANEAIKNNIKKVAFDRGQYKYHGRVKALADAARKEGLEF